MSGGSGTFLFRNSAPRLTSAIATFEKSTRASRPWMTNDKTEAGRTSKKESRMSIVRRAVRLNGGDAYSTGRKKEPPMKFAFLGYHSEPNWGAMSKSDQDA